MKRRWWIPLLFLSVGLNVGLLFVRFSPQRRAPPPPGRTRHFPDLDTHLSRMSEHLSLSDDQRRELRTIYEGVFPDLYERKARIREARRELQAAYRKPQLDTEELGELLQRLVVLQGEFDSRISETILQETSVLSAEQRELYIKEMPWTNSGPPPGKRPAPPGERGPPRHRDGPPPPPPER